MRLPVHLVICSLAWRFVSAVSTTAASPASARYPSNSTSTMAVVASSSQLPCTDACYIDMRSANDGSSRFVRPSLAVWIDVQNPPTQHHYWSYRVTSTCTMVTIINTVLNTTTTSTRFREDYKPPPTNTDGTRIEAVTYSRFGTTYTTTIAFPTPHIVWPEYYVWSGIMEVTSTGTGTTTGGPARATCQTATADKGSTVSVLSNPQPTGSADLSRIYTDIADMNTDLVLSENPGGLGYELMIDWDVLDWWQFGYFSNLFPDQQPLAVCEDLSLGPNWGGFTQTDWMVAVNETVFVGDSPSPVATPNPPKTPVNTATRSTVTPPARGSSSIPPPRPVQEPPKRPPPAQPTTTTNTNGPPPTKPGTGVSPPVGGGRIPRPPENQPGSETVRDGPSQPVGRPSVTESLPPLSEGSPSSSEGSDGAGSDNVGSETADTTGDDSSSADGQIGGQEEAEDVERGGGGGGHGSENGNGDNGLDDVLLEGASERGNGSADDRGLGGGGGGGSSEQNGAGRGTGGVGSSRGPSNDETGSPTAPTVSSEDAPPPPYFTIPTKSSTPAIAQPSGPVFESSAAQMTSSLKKYLIAGLSTFLLFFV